MAQSVEYPDLWWGGPPASYTKGRTRPVQYAVIHTTEGTEGLTSAEAGAAYDRVRTDGTSTHYFADQDNVVQCVLTTDRAHHARYHGNQIGIGHELCGRAGQTDAQWDDPASVGTLRNTARQVARDCVKYGLEVRRLSVAEVRAAYYAAEGQRPRGICGHIDVTNAYPEDGGTHWDPGPHFPWTDFLAMVRAEMGEDMPLTPADAKLIFDYDYIPNGAGNPDNPTWATRTVLAVLLDRTAKLQADVDELQARPPVVAGPVDPAALKAVFLDPEVQAVLREAARQGAEIAEDS